MEPRIQVMPPPLANQIAAGEVVERPASVVKELIENALDAGARRIEIEVSGGGMKRILVADDGAGIRPDDARLAFQRHATSKVRRAEDLAALATLGFRGEALPSIASVSRTTLVTRRRSSAKEHGGGGGETGTKVVVEGGVEVEIREAPAPPGTAVEVRDLFFNTPARLKFLKSERTELSRIVEAASNAALAFPEVGFHLKTGKKVLLDLPPTDREGRVRALLPAREAEGLFPLPTPSALPTNPTEARPVRVEGFASLPSVTRAGRSCQHVVINGRTVRDQTVVGAAYDVYRGLIPSGRHPLLFLYVTMDPADLDVNVHPAKAEVRFRDGGRVFSAVRRALGEGLITASGVVGDIHASPAAGETEFPGPGGAGRPSVAKVYPLRRPADRPDSGGGGSARPASWKFGFSGGRRAGGGGGRSSGMGRVPAGDPGAPAAHSARPAAEAFPDLSPGMDSPLPLLDTAAPKHLLSNVRVIGQLHGTFVLLEHPCGLLVMDQHTAHERVLFARLTEKADAGRVERQALLIPANVEVSAAEAPWVSERLDDLDRLGLRIEPFGPTTFIVREVPALLAHVDPSVLAREVIEALAGEDTAGGGAGSRKKNFSDLAAGLIDRMACRGAVKAHHRMSNEEIEHLVSECLELDILFTCPHGRPITLVLPKEEVERRFLRR